jgi:hypothetical protein
MRHQGGRCRAVRVAVDIFDLIETFNHAGDDAKTVSFLQRYLRDFKDHAPIDLVLVAHAKLGVLLLRQSCPVATYHGACVETILEMRHCPNLGEGPSKSSSVSNQYTPSSRSYSVDVAKSYRRDPRLLREAMEHLNAVVDSSRCIRAEREAMVSPIRQRALANAKAQAILDLATPLLDKFMATAGVPEDLEFGQPTQFDSPCEAQGKARTLKWSSRRFMGWLRTKDDLARKLLRGAHQAMRSPVQRARSRRPPDLRWSSDSLDGRWRRRIPNRSNARLLASASPPPLEPSSRLMNRRPAKAVCGWPILSGSTIGGLNTAAGQPVDTNLADAT